MIGIQKGIEQPDHQIVAKGHQMIMNQFSEPSITDSANKNNNKIKWDANLESKTPLRVN
jgi:hypothetical protein